VAWLRWTGAVAAPAAITFAAVPLRDHVLNTNVALILAVVSVGVAVVAGPGPAVLASVVGAVLYDLALTEPFWSLRIHNADDVTTALLLVLIGVVAAGLVIWARRQQEAAVRHEAAERRLRRQAELAAGSDGVGRLLTLARDELCDLLGVDTCLYEPGPPGPDVVVMTHDGLTVPAGSAETQPWVALPIRRAGRTVGHFLIAVPPQMDGPVSLARVARPAAVTFADQLGATLDNLWGR
jgi:K+-sensing histidine kinase KdpD